MYCYICDQSLEENKKSLEHVIPNALGGRLVTYDALCANHNHELGQTLDTAFIEIFASISRRMNLSTDRKIKTALEGKHGSLGIQIVLKDGKVFPVKPYYDHKTNTLYAKDNIAKKQYIKKLERDGVNTSTINFRDDLTGIITFKFDLSNEVFRAGFAKIAANFCAYHKIRSRVYEHLFDRGSHTFKSEQKMIPWLPDVSELLLEENELQDVMHIIALRNDPINNLLYCYIELFSTFKGIILLQENWAEKISYNYLFNLTQNREMNIEEYLGLFPKVIEYNQLQNISRDFKCCNIFDLYHEVKNNLGLVQVYNTMLFEKLQERIMKMAMERKLKMYLDA